MFAPSNVSSQNRHHWSLAVLLIACMSAALAAKAQDYSQQPPYPPQNGYPSQAGDPAQMDPPSRVARVSVLQGNVSLQPAGVEDFSAASLNYPLTTGDRIYSDMGSVTELEAGQLAIRLGSGTDLSVTSMTDQLAQFGLGQGSIHVRTYDLDPNSTLEIDTPNVAVTVLAPGDLRVNVSPDGTMTQVTLLSGQARVDGPGFQQQMQPGESLQLSGSEPVNAQDVRRPHADDLDRFSSDRDRTYQSAIAMQSDYLSPDTIGAADLGQYGDWSNDGDNGPVWYPRGVAVDWQPYSVGHWAYIAPWGWTWVENEPWGFAPFHYGRWARFGTRWGWVPGPHTVRPIYSPALVAFVGGGVGVTAWFPLGPREPFVPWYRTSSLYANRVNVSNIYSRNTVEIRNIYNQRTTNVYINNGNFNRGYANRSLATVAVPQAAFAGGRPVREVAMRGSMQQFANAPVLNRPNATPTRAIMAPAPARALPPRMNRPPVESRAPFNNGGGLNRPGGENGGRNGFGNGNGQPAGNRPGSYGNQPAYGNQSPNNGNRPGSYNNQPGNVNGAQYPIRGSGYQPGQAQAGQQNQQPAQGSPNRGTNPTLPQSGDGRQGPPRTYEPGLQPGPHTPLGRDSNSPSTTTPQPGNAGQVPNRGSIYQPGQGQPAQQPVQQSTPGQPGRGTFPTQTQPNDGRQGPPRTFEPNQRPGQFSQPGQGAITPGTNQPSNAYQYGNRGNGSQPNQLPQQVGQPAQTQPAPRVPPANVPIDRGQSPRDFRGQPGTATVPAPTAQPQAPAGNIRQWQQTNAVQPQNRPQPPAQAPREMPMRMSPPQPVPQPAQAPQRQPAPQQMIAPRPPAPQPAARPPAPAPAPRENRRPQEDKKQ